MGIFSRSSEPDISAMMQKRDVEGLIKALKHSNPNIRLRAAQVLGEIGDTRAVGPFIDVIRKEKDNDVQWSAIEALVKVAPSEVAMESFVQALKGKVDDVRWNSLEALLKERKQKMRK
ncbi:MAG: HEAT repeat domain-containing protein [Candidatus Bathyarchaeota archaeon]|nr:HEAT repeat domain-containing protein [Candidatus Bathyarchaeota archaeon]